MKRFLVSKVHTHRGATLPQTKKSLHIHDLSAAAALVNLPELQLVLEDQGELLLDLTLR